MEIVYILFGIVLGYFLFDKEQKALKEFKKFLSSPVNERLEVNWTTRQLLSLVSKRASERWYEARAHLHQNIFLSMLCALHLIQLVRVDFIDDDQQRVRCKTFTLHGFQSIDTIMKQSERLIKVASEEINKELSEDNKMSYYQTFVAGYNVVEDFMNGSFVR